MGATGVEPATFGLKVRYFAFQFRPSGAGSGIRTTTPQRESRDLRSKPTGALNAELYLQVTRAGSRTCIPTPTGGFYD
jgi:hypothetical protein